MSNLERYSYRNVRAETTSRFSGASQEAGVKELIPSTAGEGVLLPLSRAQVAELVKGTFGASWRREAEDFTQWTTEKEAPLLHRRVRAAGTERQTSGALPSVEVEVASVEIPT